jgi:hypothetical protein
MFNQVSARQAAYVSALSVGVLVLVMTWLFAGVVAVDGLGRAGPSWRPVSVLALPVVELAAVLLAGRRGYGPLGVAVLVAVAVNLMLFCSQPAGYLFM